MIIVVVTIQVKSFKALEEFERLASKIMKLHNGKILKAFETLRKNDYGEEVHVLEFSSHDHFENYRADTKHQELIKLRSRAIESIAIKISTRLKTYE